MAGNPRRGAVDVGDPRLDAYRSLADPAARTTLEGELGIFVAEGEQAIARLVDLGVPFRSVLVDARRAARHDALLAAVTERGGEVLVAPPEVLRDTVGFDLHRGLVATCPRPPEPDLATVAAPPARRLLVLEALNDHENLGVIFRSAAALGADGVVLDRRCADPLYRRTVRVSIGNVLAVPWCRADVWPEALAELRSAGWVVAALALDGAVDLDAPSLAAVDRLALLAGAEGPGLTAEALAASDLRVRIPMARGVDSLNVGTAVAVALHAARPTDRR